MNQGTTYNRHKNSSYTVNQNTNHNPNNNMMDHNTNCEANKSPNDKPFNNDGWILVSSDKRNNHNHTHTHTNTHNNNQTQNTSYKNDHNNFQNKMNHDLLENPDPGINPNPILHQNGFNDNRYRKNTWT